MFVYSIQVASCISVIPNLRYLYPQEYESGHLGVREKNWIMAEKAHTSACRSEITAPILITNILLIWRLKFMEIACQGLCKWKKGWEPLKFMICEKKVNMPKVYDFEMTFWSLIFRCQPQIILTTSSNCCISGTESRTECDWK